MPRILVIDDEPGVQESLRMLLKHDYERLMTILYAIEPAREASRG